MKTRMMVLVALLAGLMADQAWALCEVQATPQTYSDGTVLNGNVCDTNGALKISGDIGNVSISNADGAITDGVSAAIKATVKDYTNSNPLTTILVDTNGDPASVGGSTQYDQGTASTTTDTMNMLGCVRVDTPAVASGVIDGDRARCIVDSTNRVWVHVGVIDGTVAVTQSGTWNIAALTSITNPVAVTGTFWQATQPVSGTVTANAGTGNFTVTQGTGSNLHVVCDSGCSSSSGFGDNSAFTYGTTAVNPIAGVLDDTSTNTATENSAAVARITAQKALHMNLRNNSGTEIGTSGAPIRTDPTGSTTQPVSGTVSITANSSVNVAQMNGVTTSMGVGASGTGTQRVASLIHDGTDTAQVTATSGGSLQVECTAGCSGSGGTSSNYGSAFPSAGTAAGFTDGTNMVAGRVVTSAPSSGDAGLVVRPINPNLAADNSTNSTNKVPVLVGVATTAAPTYTTTNQVPLSLTTAGGLRVDGSAVTQPVSGTVTANAGTGNFTVTQATGTNLHMVCDSGCSSSSGFADNGAFTYGTTAINPIGGVFDDTSPNTATENSAAIARITQNKAIHTNLRNASGTEIGTSGTPIRVDPTGTTPQPASQSGTWTVQPGNTANTTPWLTSPIPATSGGTSVCYITSAASTNATNCKASAGQLYGFDLVNTTATVYYLRLYNLSSAPTCSSSTGFVRTIPIPAATTGAGIARSIPVGEAYGTGLGFCLTGGGSSTDNTNAATGVYVSLNYK